MAEPMLNHMQNAILEVVRERIQAAVNEAVEQACQQVRAQVNKEVDSLALNVMSFYEMRDLGDRLVIEVRKDLKTPR